MEGLRFRLSPTAIHHIAIISIINFFSIVVVGLRIYSRKVTAAGLGWDDKFILLSSVLGNTLFALYCYSVPQYHLLIADNIGLLPTFLGLFFISHIIFIFCICFIKLSVVHFYMRVFVERRLRIACMILMGAFYVWTAANLIALLNICKPLQAFWRPAKDRACHNQGAVDIFICVFNAASDLLLIVFPMRSVWKLQMKRSQKVKLAAVLSLGIAVTVISILRLLALLSTDFDGDVTGTAEKAMFFSVVEPNLAILCVSLPMLQPLYRKLHSRTSDIEQQQQTQDESRLSQFRDSVIKQPRDPYGEILDSLSEQGARERSLDITEDRQGMATS